MKKIYMAAIGAFGAAFALPFAASAAPIGISGIALEQARADQSNIIQIQQRMRGGRNFQRSGRGIRGPRPGVRGPGFRGPRVVNRGGYRYWGGHRGYRYARPGYRQYNGWWFPAAAFGALVGGAIASQAAPAYGGGGGLGARHYQWCDNRYKSYRASDNTFQPYQGPRQACNSPYS